jgi:hypothetical protein
MASTSFCGGLATQLREVAITHSDTVQEGKMLGLGLNHFLTASIGRIKMHNHTSVSSHVVKTRSSCKEKPGYYATLMFYPYVFNISGRIHPYGKDFD